MTGEAIDVAAGTLRRHAVALVLVALALIAGFTAAGTVLAARASATSGTKCADSHGAFGSEYYLCGVVHGSGLDVTYVNATFDGTDYTYPQCGYFEVATSVGNFYSPARCSSLAYGPYHSTINVYRWYPRAGALNVWWITISGISLRYPIGFWIS